MRSCLLAGRLGAVAGRRNLGTVAPPPSIAAWIDELTQRPPTFALDTVDIQRAVHLQRTLPTRTGLTVLGLSSARAGDTLPPAHHLVLFQPQTTLDELGADGSSTDYNAPAPFLRRMWAGGSFTWKQHHPLIIGDAVTEMTRVKKVDYKNNMIFVHQEKTLFPGEQQSESDDFAVKEVRTHVFRTKEGVTGNATAVPDLKPSHAFTYTPTSPLLFRYSALTYNGHRIHYDKDWVKQVEGHPDLVVHGPLTATLLVELVADIARQSGKFLQSFDYRATSPMYVDRETVFKAEQTGDSVELIAEQGGRIGMKAKAILV